VGSIAEKMFKNGWMERIMEQYLKNRRSTGRIIIHKNFDQHDDRFIQAFEN
jgi:hypothetical protein